MEIKFLLIFIITVNNYCSSANCSVDTSARLKRLMSIDLSRLSNHNYKTLTGSQLFRTPTVSDNKLSPNSESKSLSIDLSALRPETKGTTTAIPPKDSDSNREDSNKDQYPLWNDIHEFDANRIGDDFEEYDYYQPLQIIPHTVYFNVWSPERPGYDALTDFLHDEHKTGRLLSNGKRDIEVYPYTDWEDNTIPVFPDATPVSEPCPFSLPKDYGISCAQFMSLMKAPTDYPKGNSIFKRDMFLSKGWGPSGSYLNIPSKFESNTKPLKVNNLRKLLNFAKIESKIVSSSQGVRQKQDNKHKANSHRWSIPHLFGSY